MINLRIECFHRVLPADARTTHWPYFARGTAITVEEFDDKLAHLSYHYELVDEAQVAEILDGGSSPYPACWITFDDGYADVLDNAMEVIDRYDVRPSIFLTTRVLDGDWWPPVDRWYSALLKTRRKTLRLSYDEISECWDLCTEEGRTRAVVGELKRVYLESDRIQRTGIFEFLCQSLVVNDVIDRVSPFLTYEDVTQLSSMGWYIGPHGHEHRLLPTQSPSELETEVVRSVETLDSMPLLNRSSWFAYSDGRHDRRVRQQVARLLSPLGYDGALTIEGRMVKREDDPWSTPRYIA